MKIAIFKTSQLENERRISIHPEHLRLYPETLRKKMVFERNYGAAYGIPDEYFVRHGSSVSDYELLYKDCEMVVQPKPMEDDLLRMRSGQVLFGWAHCVQQRAITQGAIDNELTVIAWEAMHRWSSAGEKLMHLFYKNNEIAGYAAVLHCLQLLGIDGYYGPRRRVVILGYGSVSRGAIFALHGRGFNNIHIFTNRPPHLVVDQNPDVYHGQFFRGDNGEMMVRDSEGKERLLIDELSSADVICNGVLQDPNNPLIFVNSDDVSKLKERSLIVDISCDAGMGFAFARPTSFSDPVFHVGNSVTYYSVDHTPSYLWNAASREISKVLLQYLAKVAEGPQAWNSDQTIFRAIEIFNGRIQNPAILKFQKRGSEYPHVVS